MLFFVFFFLYHNFANEYQQTPNFSPHQPREFEESMLDPIDENNVGSEEQLGQKETTVVNRSKSLVFLVVLCAAAAMGTLTYFFMEEEEEKWFLDEVSAALGVRLRLYRTIQLTYNFSNAVSKNSLKSLRKKSLKRVRRSNIRVTMQ